MYAIRSYYDPCTAVDTLPETLDNGGIQQRRQRILCCGGDFGNADLPALESLAKGDHFFERYRRAHDDASHQRVAFFDAFGDFHLAFPGQQ